MMMIAVVVVVVVAGGSCISFLCQFSFVSFNPLVGNLLFVYFREQLGSLASLKLALFCVAATFRALILFVW